MDFLLVLRETLRGVARTGIAGVISVATIGVSLLVLGWFGQVIVGAHALVDHLREHVEIDIYFVEGVSQQRVFALERTLKGMPEVAEVAYVDQDTAAKEFRALFGPSMVDALSRNPLPASLRVRIAPGADMPRRTRAVAMAVSGHETVEGVNVGDVWVDALARFVQVIIGLGSCWAVRCVWRVRLQWAIRPSRWCSRNAMPLRLCGWSARQRRLCGCPCGSVARSKVLPAGCWHLRCCLMSRLGGRFACRIWRSDRRLRWDSGWW